MKLYRTRTQEEADWLSNKFEVEGRRRLNEETWGIYGEETVIYEKESVTTFSDASYAKEEYSEYPIIEVSELMDNTLVSKIQERNNKATILGGVTAEEANKNAYEKITAFQKAMGVELNDPIKPAHYHKGEMDLFEAWSKIYPPNEYRAIMQAVAMRYMFRDKNDRVEDLHKAVYTIDRLIDFEENEK